MTEVIALPEVVYQILAVFIPVLTAYAVRTDSSNTKRVVVAVIASGALAVVQQITTDAGFTIEGLLSTFIVIVLIEVGFYASIWKHAIPGGINAVASDKVSIL